MILHVEFGSSDIIIFSRLASKQVKDVVIHHQCEQNDCFDILIYNVYIIVVLFIAYRHA
jgi:hypothetical protein